MAEFCMWINNIRFCTGFLKSNQLSKVGMANSGRVNESMKPHQLSKVGTATHYFTVVWQNVCFTCMENFKIVRGSPFQCLIPLWDLACNLGLNMCIL